MADTLHDLALIIRSRCPLVQIETREETRMMKLLERVANLEGWPLFVWTIADGLKRVPRSDVVTQTYEFNDALRHIDKTPQNGVYTMIDAQPYFDNPVNVRLVKEIAQEYHKTARTLVFVGAKLELPTDLARMSARFHLPLPDVAEIREMFRDEAQLWQRTEGRGVLKGDQQAVELMVQHLSGMCEEDARRLVREAVRDDGLINFDDVQRVLKFKRDSLGQGGLLEFEMDSGNMGDIGGLSGLKRWLDRRRIAFTGDAAKLGVDPPKGVLLLGVQGAGKSLAAKAIAGSWNVPLMRLDFAVLYNKFHGESERNLREALKQAEAMAPCVLWIDEIEKGLASDGGESDGGVSRRMLGTVLTWMAERTAKVFLVATANDVTQLPPELLRKGRMDEIFFVDLPDAPTRADIFRIHLKKRKLDPAKFDLAQLAVAAEGFSGAEIEQAIVAAIYEALAAKQPLNTAHVVAETGRTQPLSVVMAEKVGALRQWAAGRTVKAD
jgi:ATP-dependent 26S proteasome regulatory subunit